MCRRRAARSIFTAGLLAVLASVAPAQQAPTDLEVKAAFLLHFTRLVEWPGAGETDPIVVAVLENKPLADTLQQVAGGQTARRSLRIVRGDSLPRGGARPHVVFVGSESPEEARRVCAALGKAPVLTVGDSPEFAVDGGGMIGFRVTDEGRVAFDVNLARSRAAGLKISSQLLKVARVVDGQP